MHAGLPVNTHKGGCSFSDITKGARAVLPFRETSNRLKVWGRIRCIPGENTNVEISWRYSGFGPCTATAKKSFPVYCYRTKYSET